MIRLEVAVPAAKLNLAASALKVPQFNRRLG